MSKWRIKLCPYQYFVVFAIYYLDFLLSGKAGSNNTQDLFWSLSKGSMIGVSIDKASSKKPNRLITA